MKKDDLKEKLISGEFYLINDRILTGGKWRLVDKRTGIPCRGMINPKTAESLIHLSKTES